MSITKGKDRGLFADPLFIIICICFCFILSYRLVIVFFPMSNSGASENGILYFIQRALNGSIIYTDPAQPVYAIAQYTPLYYYFVSLIAKIFSIQAHDVLALFIVNRITALLLDLGLCVLVFTIIKNIFQVRPRVAYMAALITFIFLPISSRIDNLYVFLWFASLFFFLKAVVHPNKNKYLLLSVVAGVLSVFAKQSGVTILIICSIWLFATKQFKRTLLYIGLAIAALSLSILILSLSANLFYVYKNIVLGVDNGISLSAYFDIFIRFYRGEGLFFVISFVLIIILLGKQTEKLYQLLLWALCSQFALANIFALKHGSATNYLTEWLVLIIIILAIFSEKWIVALSSIHLKAALYIVGIVILARSSTFLILMYWYSTPTNHQKSKQQFVMEKNVADYLLTKRQSNQPFVIADFYSINTFLCNLLPEQYLFPQDDITTTVYYRNVYDFSSFKNEIKHRIGYLVSTKNISSFTLYDVNFTNLKKDTTIGVYFIYSVH